MEEENESEKDFPGLYAPDPTYKSDSDYSENSYEKGGKKDLLKNKKKVKNKDKGYAALDTESSGEEMEYLDLKNPLKSKRPKSFKFLQKKDKEEKEKEERKEEKRKRDDKDDKKREKKKKEQRKIREKEEKKKNKKDKKKKCPENCFEVSYPVFGVPLSIAVERSPSHDGVRLPALVRECIDYLEEKGLYCEGIYRLGGAKSKVQELKRAYNAGETTQLTEHHPHVVASLLKHFLRELPETILTVDMMPHFEDVCLIPNPRERAEAMRQLIDRLPTTNKVLLQYVLKHMGNVIGMEKETKMSSHSVCVILSPAMQISHRVLNVMFHSHRYLFGNVHIKRYVPPITSYSGAKRTIEDLRSSSEIAEEMAKQESLLTCLHSAIAAGRISQKTEEQLWEAQRIVTLLKRKLKSVQRKGVGDGVRSRLESSQESCLEESPNEGPHSLRSKPVSKENIPLEVEDEEIKNCGTLKESKLCSDTETATSSPSIKTPSSCGDKKSSDDESERCRANTTTSSSVQEEKLENAVEMEDDNINVSNEKEGRVDIEELPASGDETKHRVIPILPKPTSARAERWHKMPEREKSDFYSQHKNKDQSVPVTPQIESKKPITNVHPSQCPDISNIVLHSESRILLHDMDVLQTFNKMSEIHEDRVAEEYLVGRKSQSPAYNTMENKKPGHEMTQNVKVAQSLYVSEEHDYTSLIQEDTTLALEHEELLSVNQELTRKLQAEKTEISRLRDEIQEMQTLYGYRTHSYDSSESEGSDSEIDSDNEEDETRKQILAVDKRNKQIQLDNAALTKWIQDEREAVIRLRVAFRENEMKLRKAKDTWQLTRVLV